MTKNEINIAIHQSLGWKRLASGQWCRDIHEGVAWELPDYHGSLDAIVPVVRSMPFLERLSVLARLEAIADSSEDALLATPAQWCEAYLRAKGLLP